MKKLISTLMLLSVVLMSNPSKAIVGIATDSEATAIAGLALMDLSQIVVAERHDRYNRRRHGWRRTTYITYRVITFPAFLIAGLVLLDDNGHAEISGDISAEQIQEAELTDTEVASFQSEIEEVNAIKDIIASEVSEIQDEEERVEVAGELWTDYASALSEDTAVALYKLSNLQ